MKLDPSMISWCRICGHITNGRVHRDRDGYNIDHRYSHRAEPYANHADTGIQWRRWRRMVWYHTIGVVSRWRARRAQRRAWNLDNQQARWDQAIKQVNTYDRDGFRSGRNREGFDYFGRR